MIKNINRSKDNVNYKPYVPEYKRLGKDLSESKNKQQLTNCNSCKCGSGCCYHKIVNVGDNTLQLPNIPEKTYSYVDDQLIDDDFDEELNHQIIDNNDYVTNEALGVSSSVDKHEESNQIDSNSLQEKKESALSSLKEDDFILIINNDVFCIGDRNKIQEETRRLIFGEHTSFPDQEISIDSIIVLKNIKIKIGLFLEE